MKKIFYYMVIIFMLSLVYINICNIDKSKKELNNSNLNKEVSLSTPLPTKIVIETQKPKEEFKNTKTPNPTVNPIVSETQEMKEKISSIEKIKDKKEWFILYKQIIDEYDHILSPPETIYDYFTNEEIELLHRVVETECYDANFNSKVNVANVVLNRYASGEFGKTIKQIITSPYQFAYGRKKITEDTILAVEYAFLMEDTTNGALFFHSNKKTNTFNGAKYIFTDSIGHHFYK